MSFLTAEWRKLILANYAVAPKLLTPHLPFGTELDFWNNKCYLSLVGFRFVNTRLLGVKIPWHTNFEEINLRFYVKRRVNNEWRRGVVFIKEIVPKPAITFVANTLYNENYETLPTRHHWQQHPHHQEVGYSWRKNGQWQQLRATAALAPMPIEPGSEAEFITEHYWGYARVNSRKSNEYEVKHPRWEQYKILSFGGTVNFAATYGHEFAFLNGQKPASVMLAEGSEISVEPKGVVM